MLAENVYEMINWPTTPLLHPYFLSRLHLPASIYTCAHLSNNGPRGEPKNGKSSIFSDFSKR